MEVGAEAGTLEDAVQRLVAVSCHESVTRQEEEVEEVVVEVCHMNDGASQDAVDDDEEVVEGNFEMDDALDNNLEGGAASSY